MHRPLQRLALSLCPVVLAAQGYVFWSVRHLVAAGQPDFTSFYSAALMLRRGRGPALYDLGQEFAYQQQFAPAIRLRNSPLPFLRPAFETLIFVPLTFLPYTKAYLLWTALGCGFAMAVPFLLGLHGGILPDHSRAILALLPLTFTPVFLALIQGQDSILLLLVYTLVYLCLKKHNDFGAGACLALACFKPQLTLPIVLILLVRRSKSLALGFTSTTGLLLGCSVLLVGWRNVLHYPIYVWSLEQNTGREIIQARDSPNLRGMAQAFFSNSQPSPWVLVVIGLLSALVIVWVVEQNPRDKGEQVLDLVFCNTTACAILVSYHLFGYDLCILVLPILLLVNRFADAAKRNEQPLSIKDTLGLFGPMLLVLLFAFAQLLFVGHHFMYLLAPVLLFWIWKIKEQIMVCRLRSSCFGSATGAS